MRLSTLLLALLLLPAALAATIDSLEISPGGNVTTTATLSCLITASGTGALSANITWYLDGALHPADTETLVLTSGVEGGTSAQGNIEAADTTKGDSWVCQAALWNGTDLTSANSSAVTIRNSPPTLTSPTTTQVINEDFLYTTTATATDADGDPIVQFISSDLNASLYESSHLFWIAADGDISFTPEQVSVGNHTMAILAYDGEEFGGQNVLFTVTEVDDEPLFASPLLDQNATALEPFNYTITVSDEENDPLNFTYSASLGSITLTQTGPLSAVVSFAGGAPQYSQRGVHQVNVTVYQNASPNQNTTQTFLINVTALNRAPMLEPILNQTGVQGENFTLSVNATDNDTEDTLLFTVSSACAIGNPWSIATVVNTSNATGTINLTLTNDHVVCNTATISVRDYEGSFPEGGVASQEVYFNITNINDAPALQRFSHNASNFKGQSDLQNLTAYTGVPFSYLLNATDPDLLTYASDTLTYGDSTALFVVDSATGLVSFTPAVGSAGNYLINLTVTDGGGLSSSAVMNLTIQENYPPAITPVPTIVCQEDAVCAYNFTATDNDPDENLTFSANVSLVNFTQTSYNVSLFNATFANGDVGNYSVNVTVTDLATHRNSTAFTLIINNTNDAPFFDGNMDGFNDSLSIPSPVVADHQTAWIINATDVDWRNVPETLSYSADIINGTNLSLFTMEKLNETQARILFTPREADTGSYTVNITVTDLAGASDSRLVSFFIYNASQAPVITAVRPFHNGTVQLNSTLTATGAGNTTVTFAENTTVTYNLSFTDGDSAPANLTVRYYVDGALVQTSGYASPHYEEYYDFFSSGLHTVVAVVEDEFFSNDTFTWFVTVTDVNRAPVFTPAIANRTINTTTVLSSELDNFIDPDDDRNSNGIIDGNETNGLAFTMTANPYMSVTFTGYDVQLRPLQSGITTVNYYAFDAGGLEANSNAVTYIIVYNPEQSSSSSSGSSGGGGGGGSARIPQRIPTPEPYSLELIAPKPITIYVNETVEAPLTLKNTGKSTLSGITLGAVSEANLTFSFSESQIAQIESGGTHDVTLTISGFRNVGTAEVLVTGAVLVPQVNDSAIIYINSIEQKKEGDEAVSLKITYARDFLSENPACGELVQLVDQAEQAYRNGDETTASELLTAVTDGCTFLKKQVAEEVQVPSALAALAGYKYINLVLGAMLVVLLVSGVSLLVHYGRQQ